MKHKATKIISDIELFFKKYDMETIAYSIKVWPFLTKYEKTRCPRLELYSILHTQILDAEFCVKYILNDRYAYNYAEESITDKIILKLQPHINPDNLKDAWSKYGVIKNGTPITFYYAINRRETLL